MLYKYKRYIASFLLVNFVFSTFSPSVALALTSGPSAPEFSSFEPVGTTDMVDVSSGDFTYNLPVVNIPGPEGGGYAMSLSYHSGASIEEEASWVGYGWTLNPGAINRQTMGFPDDYNGAEVQQFNRAKPNWTGSVAKTIGLEVFSVDGSLDRTARFNNYKGFQKSWGISIGYKGMGSLKMQRSEGETTFGVKINPVAIMKAANEKKQKKGEKKTGKRKAQAKKEKALRKNNDKEGWKDSKKSSKGGGSSLMSIARGIGKSYASYSLSQSSSFPFTVSEYRGLSFNWTLNGQVNPTISPVGFEYGYGCNFNWQVMNDTEEDVKKPAYGYMYANSEHQKRNDKQVLNDYTIEKGSVYDDRDFFMGIPFNSADNYALSGEGLSGSFKYHHNQIGTFYPSKAVSNQAIINLGFEGMIGADLGLGFDLGVGFQTNISSDWTTGGVRPEFEESSNIRDDGFMRFTGDMGGKLEYSNGNGGTSSSPIVASTDLFSSIPGLKGVGLENLDVNNFDVNQDDLGATSNIKFSTKSEYINGNRLENTTNLNLATLIPSSNLPQHTEVPDESIVEYEVINSSAARYVYGLPVYVKDEANLQFGVDANNVDNNKFLVNEKKNIDDPYNSYIDDDIMPEWKRYILMGDKKTVPYVSTYLLTQITNVDYVDMTGDGPSDDDLGGWTKFNYRKLADDYRYRFPYEKLLYNQNDISSTDDDWGSVSAGHKQAYYLESVETKTHIAYFVTNNSNIQTGNPLIQPYVNSIDLGLPLRKDSKGAPEEDTGYNNNGEATDFGQEMEYLDRIVLYSKDRTEKPISTTRFEYDNSLCQGLPNSMGKTGKLTLKKVWFESEGIKNYKVAPYSFDYTYPTDYPTEILNRYPNILDSISDLSLQAQNPTYKPYALDAWGNYQENGDLRHQKMQEWLSQNKSSSNFDPAAWQLKQISLPSGGEIHIHYEQDDYSSVQDREPMAMVSLLPQSVDEDLPTNTKYYLNIEDLGMTFPQTNSGADFNKLDELKLLIQKVFMENPSGLSGVCTDPLQPKEGTKMFFKFLYALKGQIADLDNCRTEYIDGYTSVNSVETEEVAGKGWTIAISLGNKTDCLGDIGNNINSSEKKDIPKQVCYDFVLTSRGGLIDNDNCTSIYSDVDDKNSLDILKGIVEDKALTDYIHRDNRKAIYQALNDNFGQFFENQKAEICLKVNFPLSYLRIPINQDKKGGGIRVAKLMMYDEGLETGDALLYGSEYIYKNTNGSSSGVASNEPGSIREENALVTFLPKLKKNVVARILSGRDKEQTEGPVGESLLPGASVNYARVVQKGLHSGKTGTGYTVHEFYTTKDYPFDYVYSNNGNSDIDNMQAAASYTALEDTKIKDWMNLPLMYFNYRVDKRWSTQGFLFILNNMNGAIKSVKSYAGDYVPTETGNPILISSTEYEYFKPGEKVPMMIAEKDQNTGEYIYKIDYDIPGKEEDLTIFESQIHDLTNDLSLEIDVSIGLMWTPPIYFTFMGSFTFSDNMIANHAVTKVLKYPTIVKSITNYADGIYNKQENLAFNKHTGQPVYTSTTDSYAGLYLEDGAVQPNKGIFYDLNIPASWIYPSMGQKFEVGTNGNSNENQLAVSAGSIRTYNYNILENLDANGFWNPNDGIEGLISASATTFVDDYDYNDYDKFKPKSTYSYKQDAITNDYTNSNENRVFNSGYYTLAASNWFNWIDFDFTANPKNSSGWFKSNEITTYSEHGVPLETLSPLSIYSAVKMGYNDMLPHITVQNAKRENICFKDYELVDIIAGVPTEPYNEFAAHTGKRSINLNTNSMYECINSSDGIVLSENMYSQGALIDLWLKSDYPNNFSYLENETSNFSAIINNSFNVPFKKIAQAGEWSLYECVIKDWQGIANGTPLSIKLNYQIDNLNQESVYVDDIRLQPIDAVATCYVYDPTTFKTIATFSDQHFGNIYQYDEEGRLSKSLIETEKGVKTIQEQHVNIPQNVLNN